MKVMTTRFAPDIIILNVAALSMDQDNPTAQAVAVRGDTILAVGSTPEIRDLADAHTLIIDGAAGTLLPGFVESHCHLFLGGSELGNLDLSKTGQDIATAIRHYAAENPGRPILVVQGADYGLFTNTVARDYLDLILPDRALACMSADHHTVWANTAGPRLCCRMIRAIPVSAARRCLRRTGCSRRCSAPKPSACRAHRSSGRTPADWSTDGTLVDSAPDLADALLADHGLAPPGPDQTRRLIGHGVAELVR